MAANDHRRQKKLQRRAAKRKDRQRSLIKQRNRGLAGQLAAAKSAPILDTFVGESLWDEGIGEVVISRKLPSGEVAFALFLVDAYCLGIKDAYARIVSPGEYRELKEKLEETSALVNVAPADARRMVEDAVQYARDLGLEPHPDYLRAQALFGGIDPDEATERLQFGGEDGKPLFINGPGDNPQRVRQILSILEHSCGAGGFHYALLGPDGAPRQLRDMSAYGRAAEDEESDEEEDEEDEDT